MNHSESLEKSNTLQYIRQLDGFRAVAVFAVLWTHYLPEGYWPFKIYWGGYGVQLFFVLSRAVASTMITLLLTAVSWHLFEKRINDMKRLFPYTSKAA